MKVSGVLAGPGAWVGAKPSGPTHLYRHRSLTCKSCFGYTFSHCPSPHGTGRGDMVEPVKSQLLSEIECPVKAAANGWSGKAL